jgi:hypothetical protein
VTREVFEIQIGQLIAMPQALKEISGYTEFLINQISHEKYKILQGELFEQLMAYSYLDKADQPKYGSILIGLNTQQTLGNKQYPKTITDANSVLSNHRFDNSTSGNKNKINIQTNIGKKSWNLTRSTFPFAQMEGKCYCCRKPGHKSLQCRFKDKPKSEWAINKISQSHPQASKQTPKKTEQQPTTTTQTNKQQPAQQQNTSWVGVHHQLYQAEDMRNWILLDNKSTVPIFCNPNLVSKI